MFSNQCHQPNNMGCTFFFGGGVWAISKKDSCTGKMAGKNCARGQNINQVAREKVLHNLKVKKNILHGFPHTPPPHEKK